MSLIDKVKAFEEAVGKTWDIQPVLDVLLAIYARLPKRKDRPVNITLLRRKEHGFYTAIYTARVDCSCGKAELFKNVYDENENLKYHDIPVTSMEDLGEDLLLAIERILDSRVRRAERNDAAMEKIREMSKILKGEQDAK